MKTIVLKFGGTSVGSIDRIKKVSNIILGYKKRKNRVIVVSSAMSGVTNDLIKKSKLIKLLLFESVLLNSWRLASKSSSVKGSCALFSYTFRSISS